jgi:hypothetical protein
MIARSNSFTKKNWLLGVVLIQRTESYWYQYYIVITFQAVPAVRESLPEISCELLLYMRDLDRFCSQNNRLFRL